MKDLKQLLFEKLVINNNSELKKSELSKDAELPYKIRMQFNAVSAKEKIAIFRNTEKQFTKHTSIQRLCNTNTHLYTIFNKWFVAIILQWDEEIIKLQNDIVDSNYIPNIENYLFLLVYQVYKGNENTKLLVNTYLQRFDELSSYNTEKLNKCLENYFKLYNISY